MRARRYAGIFLVSLAALLLELSLTRILSVALWYHFGFLVIATALLGFGSAGATVALSRRLRETASLDRALARLSLACGVAIGVSYWLIQHIPFEPFSLGTDRTQWIWMPLYELVLTAPFFAAGLVISLLLSRATREANRLYAFDLVGAGAGCMGTVALMPVVGGPGAVIASSAAAFAAACVFGWKEGALLRGTAVALGLAAVISAPFVERVVPIRVTSTKRTLGKPILFSAWNSFSRVDVYDRPAEGERPADRRIDIDHGTSGTGMWDLHEGVEAFLRRPLFDETRDFGMGLLTPHARVLIIGSGGGHDILTELRYGAAVTAVEINPIIASLGTQRMREWWGGIYERPDVTLVVDEGRSFVARSSERYDEIVTPHTISNAAVASGALSLSESYLYTREAFDDYFDHLYPGGILRINRPETQLPRLFATFRDFLDRHRLGPASSYAYAFRGEGRPAFYAGAFFKASPFSAAEVRTIERAIGAGDTAVETLYSPFGSTSDPLYARILIEPDPPSLYAALPYDIEPVTDDRPFFNQRQRWSRLHWEDIAKVFTSRGRTGLSYSDTPTAEAALLAILAQAGVIAFAMILWPLRRFAGQGVRVGAALPTLAYFAALGVGFIFVEMALLQRFAVFLGEPVYALAVVLAGLLLFSGAGSALAGRLVENPRGALGRRIVPLLIVVLLATTTLLPPILHASLSFVLPWRVALAAVLIAPIGLLLGMPFPTGLRAIEPNNAPLVPWAWGVNGFFTVIGSVTGLILGMAVGFRVAVIVAAVVYALGTLVFVRRRTQLASSVR